MAIDNAGKIRVGLLSRGKGCLMINISWMEKGLARLLRIAAAVLVALLGAAYATDINESFSLSADISSNGTMYVIVSDNISVDCQGHTIAGNSSGSGILADGRRNITIINCTIANFYNGISLTDAGSAEIVHNRVINSSGDGVVLDNTTALIAYNNITLCAGYGLFLSGSNMSSIFHNAIYANNGSGTGAEVYSDAPVELSYGYLGNYWGLSSCPAFRQGQESSGPGVTDSYPYTSALWQVEDSCLPRVNITSFEISYAGSYAGAGMGETLFALVNATMNASLKQEAVINWSVLNCSAGLRYNDASGLWKANCTVSARINASIGIRVYLENVYGLNASASADAVVDSIPPSVALGLPANDSYNVDMSKTTSFSFQVSDHSNISNCSIYIDSALMGVMMPNMSGQYNLSGMFDNLSIGEHTWHVNCTDLLGNEGSSPFFGFRNGNRSATPVSIAGLSVIYSNGLLSASLGARITVSANVTGYRTLERTALLNASGLNAGFIAFAYNSSTGLYAASFAVQNFTGNGSYNLTVRFENIERASAEMDAAVRVDTVAPEISFSWPENNSYLQNITPSTGFNFSVSDHSSMSNCSLYWNGSYVSSMNISSDGDYSFQGVASGPAEGNYSWQITCADSLGNTGSLAGSLQIDRTLPCIANFALLNGSAIGRENNITLALSETQIDNLTATASQITLQSSEGSDVMIRVFLDGDTLTVDPYVFLDDNETYTLRIAGLKDLAGNSMNETEIIVSVPALDAPEDTTAKIIGNLSYINTNMNLSIRINGSADLALPHNSTLAVNYTDGGMPVLSYRFNFHVGSLDLTSVMVVKNEIKGIGTVVAHGISFSGKKILYLDKLADMNGVCVRDRTSSTALQISMDCEGAGEVFVPCNGSTGDISCYDLGDRLKVTGLSYSAIRQMNDSTPPSVISSSTSRHYRNMTVRVTTDEPARCRWGVSYRWEYSRMPGSTTSPNSSGYSTSHSWVMEDLDDDDYEYFIRCIDKVGNEMQSSKNITFTIDLSDSTDDSSSSSSSSSGGGGGGSGGSSSNIQERESKTWNRIYRNENIKWQLSKSDVPVTYMRFSVGIDNEDSPSLEVRALKSKPSLVPAPSGLVYKFMEFYPENLYALKDIKITFRVRGSWFKENNADPKSVRLNRYYNKRWNELKTTYKGLSGGYYLYEAETPGFSYFSISADAAAAEDPGDEEAKESDSSSPKGDTGLKEEVTALAVDEGNAKGEAETREIRKKPRFGLKYMQPKTKLMNGIAIMLLIVAAGLAVFRHNYKRRRHPAYPRRKR